MSDYFKSAFASTIKHKIKYIPIFQTHTHTHAPTQTHARTHTHAHTHMQSLGVGNTEILLYHDILRKKGYYYISRYF